MSTSPPPYDEELRLATLVDYEVLDSIEEAVFDELATLASELFDAPIALISLVDSERQWFKARVGLQACETSRDVAFCAFAIHGDDIFEVPDARADPRFADNTLVTGPPHIRFYAGAPLKVANGQRLGTLCIIDTRARKLSPADRRTLATLSRAVVAHLEMRKSFLERSRAALRSAKYDSEELPNELIVERRRHLTHIIRLAEMLLEQGSGQNQNVTEILHASRRLLALSSAGDGDAATDSSRVEGD